MKSIMELIMKRLLITALFTRTISICFGQQSKVAEVLKQINFKLKVQSIDDGTTEVQADDEGNVILMRTIEPKFHLWESFNFIDVNMVVELMPTEVVAAPDTYILYFRCKYSNCVRFENDNGLARGENFGSLFFRKKEDADKMKALFLQLKNAAKK